MDQQRTMKFILGGKVILVAMALALHQGWIHLGDIPLVAGEDPKATSDAGKSSKEAPKSQTPDGATKTADASEKKDGGETVPDTPETKQRRSFLSDLFELPKLDTSDAKKAEIGKYLSMAERKERQIDERVVILGKREEELKAIEHSIDNKLVKIDEERKFIAQTIQEEKDLKGERLDKLVELFDKMEPKKAAPQFEKLDKDLAVALFKRLKQKQVTTILELMNPDKSVELAEYFGRVKSAREYDILKELNASLRKEFQDCKGMPEGEGKKANAGDTQPPKTESPGKTSEAAH